MDALNKQKDIKTFGLILTLMWYTYLPYQRLSRIFNDFYEHRMTPQRNNVNYKFDGADWNDIFLYEKK
jgi:hypothetical protein